MTIFTITRIYNIISIFSTITEVVFQVTLTGGLKLHRNYSKLTEIVSIVHLFINA